MNDDPPQSTPASQLLTESQAARLAQVDKRTLRKLIEAGRLRAMDFGTGKRRHFRIDLADLKTIPAASQSTQTPSPRPRRRGPSLPLPSSVSAYLPTV